MKTTTILRQSMLVGGMITSALTARASTDYAPAIWNPPCNANYYTTGNGHRFHVIHDMEGYYLSVISMFKGCSYTGASIHYLVNGKQDASSDAAAGEVTQMVRDANYAWHAICWNTYATGTEHEGFVSNPAWYTEAQYQASAGVTRHLSSAFGWAKDRNHVVGHNAKTSSAWVSWAGPNLGIDPTCNTHSDPGPYWDWAHYMDLVNGGAPASVPFRLDVFARGGDNGLWHKWYQLSGGWQAWETHGGTMTSDAAAVSWANGRIDMFFKGSDNTLQHQYYASSVGWSGIESLGGTLAGKPAVSSLTTGRLDVFYRGTDNALWHKYYTSSGGWSGLENLGGTLASDPSAVSWSNSRIDVFYRGTDNTLQHRYWTSTTSWSGVESLGGTLVGAPSACSWASGRLDVFIRGTDNTLTHKFYSNGWSGWQSLGGTLSADPGAVSGELNRIDVFIKGTDNALWHTWYDGSWNGFESLGGTILGAPCAASWSHTN